MPASSTLLPQTGGSVSGIIPSKVIENPIAFVDGGALNTGTVPPQVVPLDGGHLSGVGVKAGTIPFNAITVAIKDKWGTTIARGTLTATGRLESFAPQPFVGDLTIVPTGNTTPDADFTVILFTF